jgi:hypothetical protein
MVLLSILPCNDELEAHEITTHAIVTVTHQQDASAAESCSPLCLCACCGQQVVAPSQTYFEMPISIAKAKNITIVNGIAPQKRAFGIWQPPKLV